MPNYPCKITYQFFNGDFNIYVIDIGDNKEETILEGDLRLYANNSNDYGTIHGMQEEILALQRRMTILEVEVSKANREYKAFSSPISKVKGGGGSNPYKVEADVIK